MDERLGLFFKILTRSIDRGIPVWTEGLKDST
jgi:hypothetical protein